MGTYSDLNHTQRLIIWELLHALDTHPVKIKHELSRLAHTYRDGLTDKEYAFLMKRCEVQEEETRQLVKLKDRLKGTIRNGRT